MYEIRESIRRIDGIDIPTYTREVCGANILDVEAGTNGYQGGDTGHGSRTYFRITNCGGTDIQIRSYGHRGTDGFEVILGGDSELETIIRALKFITKVLEEESKEVYD